MKLPDLDERLGNFCSPRILLPFSTDITSVHHVENFRSPWRKVPLVTDFYYFLDVKIDFHVVEKYFCAVEIYFLVEKIVFLLGFCNFAAHSNGFISAVKGIYLRGVSDLLMRTIGFAHAEYLI